jgi:hypothetical protein
LTRETTEVKECGYCEASGSIRIPDDFEETSFSGKGRREHQKNRKPGAFNHGSALWRMFFRSCRLSAAGKWIVLP